MKKDLSHLDHWAMPDTDGDRTGADGWMWQINRLKVIASWGCGWDHVSVSLVNRVPTWEEMCWVKDQFFEPEEVAVQYHPRKIEYVNCHPYCLHLWRKQDDSMPTPPTEFVGTADGIKP